MDLQKSMAFYKDRFADASDFTFVFAGSFEPAAIRPLVERYLGALPSLHRHETWRDVGMRPPKGVVEKTVRKGVEPKSQADIVFTGPFAYDSAHEVALDALAIVLETRLRQTLREALHGTYGVGVEANASKIPEARYNVTIDFGCDPARTEDLVRAVFREIETLKAQGPTGKDVSDAREALRRKRESDLAQNSHLVAEIAERYELSEDVGEFFDLPAEYEKLSAAAIQDAARRYLDTGNYVRVTLYPEPQGAPAGRQSLLERLMAPLGQPAPVWQPAR
jgi:zinc protease